MLPTRKHDTPAVDSEFRNLYAALSSLVDRIKVLETRMAALEARVTALE